MQLVELKNGENLNGLLINCDNFMNITLREVYQTSPDGDRFWKLRECYIRGSTVRSSPKIYRALVYVVLLLQIKYLRVPDNLLDVVKEEQNRARDANRNSRGGHTGGGEDTNTYQRSNLTDAILSI
jgi:U6 snRNA-associated Sm-like protein LSm4